LINLRTTLFRFAVPAILALGGAGQALAEGALMSDSPFLPAAAGSAEGLAVKESTDCYELAGSLVKPAGALVCLFNKSNGHSLWIPVGGSEEGIEVLAYDSKEDRVTFVADGVKRELTLRKVASKPAGGSGLPPRGFPVASSSNQGFHPPQVARPFPTGRPIPVTTRSPEVVHQETEARMLVSDLMEIGAQQRKAFEEQRARAEAAKTPQN
jgi:hypothetical protein